MEYSNICNENEKKNIDNLSLINFIYENNYSIPDELCDNIIELFDLEENKKDGRTLSGVNKEIKDTTDFTIPNDDKKWEKIYNFLVKELHKNIKLYNKKIMNDYNFDKLIPKKIFIEGLMVQRYLKGIGKYVYHDDGLTDYKNNKRRIITYIWYLNDIEEGGETEFFNKYKIKPKTGKIVLFPANWCFPHCGKVPLSSNKYIITGWIYTEKQ